MDAEALMSESVADRFMRYVRLGTESDDDSDQTPSTSGQWDLARMLAAELSAMGLDDVIVDDHAFVIACLKSNQTSPGTPVGFLAHLDTVPRVPGQGVNPIMHSNYQGGDIQISPGVTLSPKDTPDLEKASGCDIITSDGSTLLGADDKAGVAAIMRALALMIMDPQTPRPDIWVAFTPDEEIGKGIAKFPYSRFGASIAYTLDGGGLGEIEEETFNAINGRLTLRGVSTHTGTARGKMVNALHLAAQVLMSLPAGARPETTDGREGFVHPNDIAGTVERVDIKILLRDFDSNAVDLREKALLAAARAVELAHPGARITWERTGGYRNMKEALDSDPRVVEFARQAVKMEGLTPVMKPIRGGTDGARLCFSGILTPNLFTGGGDFHSRKEWVCVQWMEKAARVVVNLAGLWAAEKP